MMKPSQRTRASSELLQQLHRRMFHGLHEDVRSALTQSCNVPVPSSFVLMASRLTLSALSSRPSAHDHLASPAQITHFTLISAFGKSSLPYSQRPYLVVC